MPMLPLSAVALAFLATGASSSDSGKYVWASNDTTNGSICNSDLTLFDCNLNGAHISNSCANYTTLQSCLDECDSDPLCRWVTYGLDESTLEGYFRCATFMACPTKSPYRDGDPQLYYKEPVVGTTTYEWAFNNTFCSVNTVFDCYDSSSASLVPTYEACNEFADVSKCQAECDSRSNCNFMLWGYDWGDYYRCTLFEACSGVGEYETGDMKVWRKTTTLPSTTEPHGTEGGYNIVLRDRICNEEHQLFDCLDVGDDDLNDCAPYSTAQDCEAECEKSPACRFYTWGWDDVGHWRCITFTSCEEDYAYSTGSPNVYQRQTEYQMIDSNAFSRSPAVFDCVDSSDEATACSQFMVLADCEAMCSNDQNCQCFAWGKDFSLQWRCATFSDCSVTAEYDNGIVATYVKATSTSSTSNQTTVQSVPQSTTPQASTTLVSSYCVRLASGRDGGDVQIAVLGSGLVWTESDALGLQMVVDRCFDSAVAQVFIKNSGTDRWTGGIMYSTDAGATWGSMTCSGCRVGSDTSTIMLTDGDDESEAPSQGATHCVGACTLFPQGAACADNAAIVGATGAWLVNVGMALALYTSLP